MSRNGARTLMSRACALLTAAALVIVPYPVRADPAKAAVMVSPALNGMTALEGGHFRYDLAAGASAHDGMTIANPTAAPITVSVYAVDMLQDHDGGLVVARADNPRTGAAAWITPSVTAVAVAAHARVDVPFTINVPVGAPPGDLIAAVVASTTSPAETGGVNVEARAALRVSVRVVGHIDAGLRIGTPTVSRDHHAVAVDVRNTGNVLTTLAGSIDVGGRRLALRPPTIYVIPGGHARLTARWADPPMLGHPAIQAHVEGVVDRGPRHTYASARVRFWIIPWPLLAASVAAVVAVVAILRVTRIRRRQWLTRRRDERYVIRRYRAGLVGPNS